MSAILKEKYLDKKYEKISWREMADAPVSAISGVSEKDSKDLKEAFGIDTASELAENKYVNIARKYKSHIKGHYTDYVNNLQDYPKVGMGGANVGPEFSGAEFDSLEELVNIEEGLVKEGRITTPSNFKHILIKNIIDSNRWKKWLLNSERGKNFFQLSSYRQKWLLETSSRYVWAKKVVSDARSKLYENLASNGINGEEIVLRRIDKVMKKYFTSFNLKDSISKIEQELGRTESRLIV